ncbi:MAG: hypothetical protein VKN33_03540 [Candidatus Sericytochromatia bacterium]|nr:hypothetical protein [Candidatus Sericytochromatia bacterium]
MASRVTTYGASISFSPQWWSYVSSTRIMVASFCNVQLANEEIADKVAMSAQELLENAVKYSASPDDNVTLEFQIHEGESIVLEVRNRANRSQIEGLRAHFAEISEGDPLMAYLARMQRIAQNPEAEGSQLGLARIRYETGCDLEMRIDDDVITMRVEFPLAGKE